MRKMLLAVAALALALTAVIAAQQKGGSLATQDYIDIQQLYARYNHAMDTGNAEAWADTFTPDGTFNTTWKNRQGLIDFIHQWVGQRNGANRRHWNSNLVITPSPDGATGTVYLMLLDVGAKPPVIASTSKYSDVLVKTAQGWRFKSRVVRPDPAPANTQQ
jgi:SnoaL-like domain